jgi:chromosome segregation ATPase
VNCPKCGYSQEERADCKKCGIVFAKYYAIRKPTEPQETVPAVAPENGAAELVEMQRALRDLTRRYGEVEFERAERQRLREEIRALEHRFEAEFAGLSARISETEKGISEVLELTRFAPEEVMRLKQSIAEQLDPLLKRVEQIEGKLEILSRESRADARIMEFLRILEQRTSASEAVIAKLAAEPKPVDGGSDVAELRAALQAVTLRYSEIGDLKKNNLVLLNRLETLQHDFDSAKNNGNRALHDKIREMEIEVPALRAEVRQILKHMETLDAAPQSGGEAAVNAIKEEMDGVIKAVSDLGSELALLRVELSQVEENILPPPMQTEPVPAAPLEEDVRAIRKDMKEIRSFIYGLANK